MRPRYLLLAGDGQRDRPPLHARAVGDAQLRCAFCEAGIAAFVNERCRCLALGDRGCVIGTLFHRSGPAECLGEVGPGEARAVLESGGDRLISRFWGGYVSAISGPASAEVIRDPSGALPCYFAKQSGYVAFASDAELLVELGLVRIELDPRALAAHFYSGGVPTSATALREVLELLPGFSLNLADAASQRPRWSPWNFVDRQATEPALAAERLERTVKHVVRSWASANGRLLASVSGGLDSSIVAAGLAQAGAEVTCLTMYGDDPNGDERRFARLVCEHLGLPLIERRYRLDEIDICEPLGSHLPRPTDRTQALGYEHAHLAMAAELDAAAFITGNGGDSVFGYSQSAAAAADRYLSEGLGAGLFATLRDVSMQTGCGLLRAAASAARIARGPRAYRCRPERLFLDRDILASLDDAALVHPWLEAPWNALPGKAAHIASILRVQQCLEPSRGRVLPVVNPLMSQPIVEACLAVPSWEWRAGGRDRSLARRAFSADLPPAVLQRRVKGGPDGFAAEILSHFRTKIRERLRDGYLARERIIDPRTVEQELDDRRPLTGEHRARLLEFVAAEAWIDSWRSRGPAATPAPTRSAVRT